MIHGLIGFALLACLAAMLYNVATNGEWQLWFVAANGLMLLSGLVSFVQHWLS